MNPKDRISLLWDTRDPEYFEMEDKYVEDLDMKKVFDKYEKLMEKDLMGILMKVPKRRETVQYRQAILRDFIRCSGLFEAFAEAAHKFYEMKNMIKFAFEREYTLYNVLKRLEESDVIIKELFSLRSSLYQHSIESVGLNNYRRMLDELLENDLFTSYIGDLKSIQAMKRVSGIKIGLNLDKDLSPNEAIVMSFEEEPFKYSRGMKKVGRIVGYGISELKKLPRRIFAPETTIPKEDLNELEKIIEPAMQQLIKFSDNFNSSLMEMFGDLGEELLLYEYATAAKKELEGMGYKTAQITFHNNMPVYMKGLYNMNLAYRLAEEGKTDTMVMNDMSMDREGNILILTGANRGGKTTFTQAIGQIYWFGLLGMFIPASSVNIRMPDGLFIHFPIEEEETVLFGRLGEECKRFADIFRRMTSDSVLLMNESFSGTSHLESLTISKESLSAVQLLGATCLFNTHLHELALQVDELNSTQLPVTFKNLVSGSREEHQSFRITEGEPLGKSYAYEIAKRYGVTFQQLVED